MTENERLRALLKEAQSRLHCERYRDVWEDCDCADCDLKERIEAALAEPSGEDLVQKALNHPAYCSVYDNGRCICGFPYPRPKISLL